MKDLKHLLASALLIPMLAALSSCDEKGPQEKPVETDEKGNTFYTSDNITPIRYTMEKYFAGSEGVSVEVTAKTANNIKFTCEPGEEVAAFRLNLYPVSILYNAFINKLNEDGVNGYNTDQTQEMIYQIISNTESNTSGGKLIKAAEFDSSEPVDWMNSDMKMIDIRPDAGYLIVAQAYFDEEATAPGDMSLVFVQSEDKEIVGDPQVEISVQTGYYSYLVNHIPNDDCAGYYYLGTTTEEIQQYIDVYGEKLYKEFLCHYGALVPVDGTLYYEATDRAQNVEYCSTALAVDKNGTPVKTLSRIDFYLATIPENVEAATGWIKPDLNKVASSICHFTAHLDANCVRLSYNAYPSAQADEIMSRSEEARKEFAELMRFGGSEAYPAWQIGNPNYSFDKEKGILTGMSYDDDMQFQHELKPETEYKIIYVCMNGFSEVSDLQVSEPFTTKKLVYDNPSACTAECTLTVDASTRTALTIGTKYNGENVAAIWWQYYATSAGKLADIGDRLPANPEEAKAWPRGTDLNDTDSWLYWFFTYKGGPYQIPFPNFNMLLFADGWGTDSDYFSGFEPGIDVYFAYIVEDWNGVLSEVKFFEGSTLKAVGGNNPQATISWEYDESAEKFKITYGCNEDTVQMKYMTASTDDPSSFTESLKCLLKDDFDGITYDEFVDGFTEQVMKVGLSTSNLSTFQEFDKSADLTVAIVLPIGGVDESTPVYGDIQVVVYRKSTDTIQTLEEYMNVK